MIIDTFTMFNEIELLEIRLNSLLPYVDQFVIVEGSLTHKGDPKPLYYMDNLERFKGFPITHVEVKLPTNDVVEDPTNPNWERENLQRQAIEYGVNSLKLPDDAIILVSDLDEIPDLANYRGGEGYFSQDLYYYYLNGFVSRDWHGTMAFTKQSFDTFGAQRMRDLRWSVPKVGHGWHYSYLGGVEAVKTKLQSFAHQELNVQENIDQLMRRFATLQDPYGRDANIQIEDLDGPAWLLANRDKYPHLIKEQA